MTLAEASRRSRARVAYTAYSAVTVASDLLPARWRYGHVRTVTRLALSRPELRSVPRATVDQVAGDQPRTPAPTTDQPPVACVLATGGLDVGGVESVVAQLAQALSTQGVAATVVCSAGGRTADALRRAGVTVTEVADRHQARAVLRASAPQVVELHNAPAYLVDAIRTEGVSVIPVVHNTEIHRSTSEWAAVARLSQDAEVTIAVSDTVRRHHLAHLTAPPRGPVLVIPNGAHLASPEALPSRAEARQRLGAALGQDLGGAFVMLCLARYDAQKNIPGLVAAFLDAAAGRAELHLVVAGGPADWLEYRRADALRRASAGGTRVHLLGSSDAAALLAGADAFILDSFFEGWPVAATEAAAVGLPLIMAAVGGAAELIGAHGERGVLVPNAAGSPEGVDDRAVRAARRRVGRQANRESLRDAIRTVHDHPDRWRPRLADAVDYGEFSDDAMVARHAEAIRAVAEAALRDRRRTASS